MKRVILGLVVVSLIAIYFLWKIIAITFILLRLAIYVVLFVFLGYVAYVLWGALMQIGKGRRRF